MRWLVHFLQATIAVSLALALVVLDPYPVKAADPAPSLSAATASADRNADSPAGRWRFAKITFYDWGTWGYGRRGGGSGHFACGGRYTRDVVAVAHRSLPCGTIVRLCHRGICVNAPVRDRFYGSGFDLTSEACLRLHHCWTGTVAWRIVKP